MNKGGSVANFSKFLLATNGASSTNLALARQAMLRPIGYAGTDPSSTTPPHPNHRRSSQFHRQQHQPQQHGQHCATGTVGFDPVNGPWDVDTDGDGIADSVWVDLGMPVQTAADGTTYKPLFAIRVLDMDGRLNVNAHGNSAQVEAAYSTPSQVPTSSANFAGRQPVNTQ